MLAFNQSKPWSSKSYQHILPETSCSHTQLRQVAAAALKLDWWQNLTSSNGEGSFKLKLLPVLQQQWVQTDLRFCLALTPVSCNQ